MIERILLIGANYRLVTFLVLMLITAFTAPGLLQVKVDTSFNSLISDSDPDRQAYLRVAEEFGSDNRTLVYVRDSKLWSEAKLAALERLQEQLELIPQVHRVESILNVRTIRGSGKSLDSRPLLPSGTRDPESLKQALSDALANPLIVGNFVSKAGDATALMVTLRPPDTEHNFDAEVNAALNKALASEFDSFTQLFQIGPSRINTELNDALLDDLQFLGPLSAGLLVLTLLLFMGSIFGALLPLVSAGLSLAWTFGLMGLLGIPLNILSAMLPSLVIVIGATEDTHLLAAWFHSLRDPESNNSRRQTTRLMMRRVGVPMLLTVLTTALGFAANIFSDISMIRDFALASTFAIISNGLITALFVPLALSLFGPRPRTVSANSKQVPGFSNWLVDLLGYGRKSLASPILILTVVACGFFLYQASKLYVTNDPFSYFRSDRALVRDANQLQKDLAGAKVFFLVLEADQPRAFLEPKNIDKLVILQEFIKEQKTFDLSISAADHIALVNREFHSGDSELYRIPRKRELIAQYLLFFHQRDLQGYLSHDFSRANILVRHNISDSRTLNPHIRELKKVARRVAGSDMDAWVVGENLMINAAAEDLISAQAKSLALLIIVIMLIMSAMFTSFKGGLVAMIPSLIPIIFMFGTMGLLGIPLNPGTAMVAVIAIGIAIDGTIHLFSRYNELSRRSSDNEQAIGTTVSEEAIPVISTSIALAVGFGVLLYSNFTIVAQFGALSAATMLFSIFANLLLTPILMSRIRLVGLYEILAMNMDQDVLKHSPLFRNMSNYQIRKAILISEIQHFKAGELLIKQGTTGRKMFLLLSGEAVVTRHEDEGEQTIAELGAGAVLGEVGYVREIERTANVRALTPVQALRFDYERMRRDLRYFPRIVAALNFNISRILGERLADAMGVPDARSDNAADFDSTSK